LYVLRTYEEAIEQIAALPNEALDHYAQVIDVLELAPWSGDPYNMSNPDGAMRQLVFGPNGRGMVTYLVLEDQRRVDVLRVLWSE
jgi:hypothetical protein